MCHYVTGTMSGDGDAQAIKDIARRFELRWKEIEAPRLSGYLLAGERDYFTTQGTCDCGTGLGALHRPAEAKPIWSPDRDLKKLRKKGWSEQKIKRSLSEKTQARDRRSREHERVANASVDRERWCDFLGCVLCEEVATHIGVLLHWYHGDLRTECIALRETKWCDIREVDADYFASIEEDVLYRFIQGSHQ